MPDTILIIDFGSQVTQLIARRLREKSIYTEILYQAFLMNGEAKLFRLVQFYDP